MCLSPMDTNLRSLMMPDVVVVVVGDDDDGGQYNVAISE